MAVNPTYPQGRAEQSGQLEFDPSGQRQLGSGLLHHQGVFDAESTEQLQWRHSAADPGNMDHGAGGHEQPATVVTPGQRGHSTL